MNKRRMVVVTTDKRGVFFGEVLEHDKPGKRIVLRDAQMCVYWPPETHGVLGLASSGPPDGSRITQPVPDRTELEGVTAIFEATDQAVERWQSCPWS